LIVAAGEPLTRPFGVTFLYYLDITIASYIAAVWASRALDAYAGLIERTARAEVLETQLATARMEYLQLQLRPHFLFNTLSSVAELGHEAPASGARMLRNVILLLESALQRHGPRLVSLGDELDTLSHYLAIERLRFADWLVIEEDVEDAARDALVPPFVLHPLVENAVHHGLVDRAERGRITIRAGIVADRLRIAIIDNGVGLNRASYGTTRGVGLRNVRERLEALYGTDATLTLEELAGEGTAASLEIPMQFAQPTGEPDPAEAQDQTTMREANGGVVYEAESSESRVGSFIAGVRRYPIATATMLWTVVALLRIQHSYVYMLYRHRYSTPNFLDAIRFDATGAAVWLGLTPLVLGLARFIPLRRNRLAARIAAHAAFASVIAFLHIAVTMMFLPPSDIPLWSMASSEVYAWNVSVYAFLLLIAHLRELERWIRDRELEEERLKREMEYASFQKAMLELRPNTLIDALRNLESTIGSDPLRAERSLADIGDFLRLTLEGMYHRELRLRDECASVRAYARVLGIATRPGLSLELEVPDKLSDHAVPNGLLRAALDSLLEGTGSPAAAHIEISTEDNLVLVSAFISVDGQLLATAAMDTHPLAGYANQGLIRVAAGHPERLRIVIKSGTIRAESSAIPSLPFSPVPQSVSAA
jgi:LytS/YehU family sensor histidine kinase